MTPPAPAGWYPPDPERPEELGYWDGQRGQLPAVPGDRPRSGSVPGLADVLAGDRRRVRAVSGPRVGAVWARPGTSNRVKGVVSAVVVGLLVSARSSEPADPVEDPGGVPPPPTPRRRRKPPPNPDSTHPD